MKFLLFITTLLLSTTLIGQSLNDDLYVHYAFDNNLNDSSPNGFDLSGSISYTNFSPTDGAANFDGSDYITSVQGINNTGMNVATMSCWLRSNTVNPTIQIFFQGAFMGYGMYIDANGHVAAYFSSNSGITYTSSNPIADGEWHHIAVSNDGTTTKMYVDGVFDGDFNTPNTNGDNASNNQLVFGNNTAANYPFTGALDDFRLYSKVVDECEVFDLYNENKPIVADYTFEGNLNDVSGTGNDLEVVGGGSANLQTLGNGSDIINFSNYGLMSTSPFDNSDYLQCALAGWIKPSSAGSGIQHIITGTNLGFEIQYDGDNDELIGNFDLSNSGIVTNGIAFADMWHHFVLQNNGNSTELYIDGNLVDTKAEALSPGNGGNNNILFIGQDATNDKYFNGSMHALKIYNRILSSCEIETLKDAVDLTVSTWDIENDFVSSIFPNPAKNQFKVSFNSMQDKIDLKIFNSELQLIDFKSIENSQQLLYSNYLIDGVYFIQINTLDGVTMKKLIVSNH